MAVSPSEPFVWGRNGQRLTPEQIERQRAMSQALAGQAMDFSPVGHWTQGLGRVAAGLMAGLDERRADQASQQNATESQSLIEKMLGGLVGSASAPSTTVSGGAPLAPAGGGGAAFGEVAPRLIADLAKDFELTPEQAAGVVGQLGHESVGFKTMQEVNPLVPGSRGGYGYAQWTGPRRTAFEQFASENGLPIDSYEANYGNLKRELLEGKEAPALLGQLRLTKDAQSAGRTFTDLFLRPGIPGYDSRDAWTRKALAFAGQDPQGGAPVQVASLDPSVGMQNLPNRMPPYEGDAAQTLPGRGAPDASVPLAALLSQSAQVQPSALVAPTPQTATIPSERSAEPEADPRSGMRTASVSPVAQALTASAPSAAPATNGINPAIIQALTSPYASESTKGIAKMLFGSQQEAQQLAAQQAYDRAKIVDQRRYDAGLLDDQRGYDRNKLLDERGYEAGLLANKNEREDARFKVTDAQAQAGLVPGSVREYNFYAEQERAAGREPKSYNDWDLQGKKAASAQTNINTGSNTSKFNDKSDEKAAERLGVVAESGAAAGNLLSDMQQLTDLSKEFKTGAGANFLLKVGPFAQALGIDAEEFGKLGPAQAYQSIIDRLAPSMRPVGSGSSSDTDVKMFLNGLPQIGNTAEGNEIINQTIQGVAQNRIDAAAIARKAQRGEMTWQDAEDQIAKLPNPYERFKEWRKSAGSETKADQPQQPSIDVSRIPPQAIEILKGQPSMLREKFDRKYGKGAAAAVLGR